MKVTCWEVCFHQCNFPLQWWFTNPSIFLCPSRWHFLFGHLLQLLTAISTIDDLNYPEKTDTYYIVNAPYVFSACWKVCASLDDSRVRTDQFLNDTHHIMWNPKINNWNIFFNKNWQVVRPLLQERTRRKVQVLQGCGRDELLKVNNILKHLHELSYYCLQPMNMS